ncbi:MAG: YkgJ family cysteine cluster protein [Deltaproteobacteria bacterium]|nr:YkgJ family cysteine cluster protein [Deltaproteobacteria bacterium]
MRAAHPKDQDSRHPLGFWAKPGTDETCGGCAWRYQTKTGRSRCRQAGGAVLDPTWGACDRWEPLPDCQDCAACCRAAYDSVTISPRDRIARTHPELVVKRGTYLELEREGNRCAALVGGSAVGEPHSCTVYEDRPRTCREFERGGSHCLTARRRLGLSR